MDIRTERKKTQDNERFIYMKGDHWEKCVILVPVRSEAGRTAWIPCTKNSFFSPPMG